MLRNFCHTKRDVFLIYVWNIPRNILLNWYDLSSTAIQCKSNTNTKKIRKKNYNYKPWHWRNNFIPSGKRFTENLIQFREWNKLIPQSFLSHYILSLDCSTIWFLLFFICVQSTRKKRFSFYRKRYIPYKPAATIWYRRITWKI